jgi:ATP-binding cassette subfamily B multidrug efflux pump
MILRKKPGAADEISGQGLDDKVGWRLLPYVKHHKGPAALATLLVFVSAAVALAGPKILGMIVDQALVPKNYALLYRLIALFAGLEILRVVSIFVQSYVLQKMGQDVMQEVRNDLFGRLIRMPVAFFDKNPVGKLVTRVTNDTMNLSELFSASFVLLLSDIILIVGVIAAMLLLHGKLGLIALSVFPLMIYFMVHFSGRLRLSFRRSREVLAQLNSFFAERMAGMPVVQLMEREAMERESYRSLSFDYREKQFDGVYLYSLFHPAITILSGISVALVIWFGPKYLSEGNIALGTLISFLAYAQTLYQPVRNITDRYNIFLAAMSSAERIFTLLDMAEEAGLRDDGLDRRRLNGELRFEKVTFRYPVNNEPGRAPALQDLSFEVKENQTIAIVGHTGAGKSTITNLLFRFYEPDSGRILLGGRDLREFSKREIRERIGFVQQEVFLFSGSVRENLALLRPNLTDAEILSAARLTGFSRVIDKLSAGLDTELDERGSNLSMGERQILAFTRAYLQRPDILVLDEATSSVDQESERLLQRATAELMRGRASIVIAHRLETVKHADQILVLKHGKLMEAGNHQDLVARGGIYAEFVRLQEAGH